MNKNREYIKQISDELIKIFDKGDDEAKHTAMVYREEYIKERTAIFGPNPNFKTMKIREKIYPGMYLHVLLMTDLFTTKRWDYWLNALYKNDISKDIPQVNFDNVMNHKGNKVKDMLRCCIDTPNGGGATSFNNFLNYLLYCFKPLNYHKGETSKEKEKEANKLLVGIDDISLKNYYENFCLEALLLYPGDYLGDLASEYLGSNGNAYFPTPHNIVDCMVKLIISDSGIDKTSSIIDPSAGSSRMLLYSSNHSLNLYANDISQSMVNVSMINGFLYIPWMVCNTEEMKNLLNSSKIM